MSRFGTRLPYLLKVLAAERRCRCRPIRTRPRPGKALPREESTAAAVRNYVDPFHKPELLVALDSFDALCGFRDPDESARDLAGARRRRAGAGH